MSPINFVTMCLTPRAAVLLREAVRHSSDTGTSPFNQAAVGDLGYALSLQRQQGGGDLYLSNDPALRNMVSSILWTAVQTGPRELRSSFRTLHRVFEKFGMVMDKDDAEKMTSRLKEESARWREGGCKIDELPALYNELYKPFAELVRKNADFMMRDGVDHWVEALINNIDVIDAFRQHEEVAMECKDVFDALYAALGIKELYETLVIIYNDVFSCDYRGATHALAAYRRDNMANMISADYSLSGLCLMNEHGDGATLALGRAADYVRRKDGFAIEYLKQMEGWFDLNPIAERARLLLLWYAINNVGVLSDELDVLLSSVCDGMADIDNKLIAKAAENSERFVSLGNN